MATTKILFMRHAPHGKGGLLKNVITAEGYNEAKELGHLACEAGYKIDSFVSSPLGRALSTGLAFLHGTGNVLPLSQFMPELGDTSTDEKLPEGMMARLKSETESRFDGVVNDANLATVMLDDTEARVHMSRRFAEGADALLHIAYHARGKTVLVVSHGVARMEGSVRVLRWEEDELAILDELLPRNGIVLLTFDVEEFETPSLVYDERLEF